MSTGMVETIFIAADSILIGRCQFIQNPKNMSLVQQTSDVIHQLRLIETSLKQTNDER
jgi:hypothetical protein